VPHARQRKLPLRQHQLPASLVSRANCDSGPCLHVLVLHQHGGVWTSCPAGELAVSLRDQALRSRYSFGTKTAHFHVCSRCGVVPVVTSHIDGTTYAVVNVNTFEGVDDSLLTRASATFDAEDEPSRLQRRKRNWISHVTFTGGDAQESPI